MEEMEGSFYCDCQEDFVGLSCEFKAERQCKGPEQTDATWFCTNGGTCRLSGGLFTCDCPSEYDGGVSNDVYIMFCCLDMVEEKEKVCMLCVALLLLTSQKRFLATLTSHALHFFHYCRLLLQHCEYIAGSRPDDWPSLEVRRPRSSTDEGLKAGVTVTIVLVCLLVGAMLAALIRKSIIRRREGKEDELDGSFPSYPTSFRKAGQNATKDPSEALNIEMVGSSFREIIMGSVGSKIASNYSFEVDSEMGTPRVSEAAVYVDQLPPPPPPASPPGSGGRGDGSGGRASPTLSRNGSVGESSRNSWGGQML